MSQQSWTSAESKAYGSRWLCHLLCEPCRTTLSEQIWAAQVTSNLLQPQARRSTCVFGDSQGVHDPFQPFSSQLINLHYAL